MEAKFCLGDKVKIKESNVIGQIVGMQTGGFHHTHMKVVLNNPSYTPAKWDEEYPDWTSEPVYQVFYNEPQWILSVEEYVESMSKLHPHMPEHFIFESYEYCYKHQPTSRRNYMSHAQYQLEGVYAENFSD